MAMLNKHSKCLSDLDAETLSKETANPLNVGCGAAARLQQSLIE